MKQKIIAIGMLIMLILITLSSTVMATDMPDLEISSPSAILVDANTGRVFYEKDADTKRYPASTTKIMTALLVLENVEDLQQVATVSYDAVFSIPSGYATDLLKVGEELTIEELLYALLVKSSNEAAVVLAEYVAGSVDSFVSMMNTKAAELGCNNTNFVNPNGVHDENHYTTARDLATIAREAMKNEDFKKFVSTASHTLPGTNKYERTDRSLVTTNDLIRKSSTNYYSYATGIKTGFTTPAQNCLVAGASHDGVDLIAVVLKTGDNERYQDAKTLFNYVYDNFGMKEIVKQNDTVQEISVKNATKDTKNLKLLAKDNIQALVTNDKLKGLQQGEVTLNEDIKAPIAQGTVLGSIKYTIDGIEYSTDLVAANDVKASYTVQIMIGIVILLIVLYIIKRIAKPKKRKKRKKKSKYVSTMR